METSLTMVLNVWIPACATTTKEGRLRHYFKTKLYFCCKRDFFFNYSIQKLEVSTCIFGAHDFTLLFWGSSLRIFIPFLLIDIKRRKESGGGNQRALFVLFQKICPIPLQLVVTWRNSPMICWLSWYPAAGCYLENGIYIANSCFRAIQWSQRNLFFENLIWSRE